MGINAGAGNKKTYTLKGTANSFDNQSQLSFTAGINNINKSNVLGSSILDNNAMAKIGQKGLNKSTNFAVNARAKIGQN